MPESDYGANPAIKSKEEFCRKQILAVWHSPIALHGYGKSKCKTSAG